MAELNTVLEGQLNDRRTSWSVGSYGAIAEFHRDADELSLVECAGTRATARGAIRIERLEGVTPVAWEALSKNPSRWQQGVALCLPDPVASRAARAHLTELGPDKNAIREQDRDAVLFDMGLGQRNVDFCVRTADAGLIDLLRGVAGEPLTRAGNPAMPAILAAHPHRVALSAIGRCEVYQKIGGPETGGVSPHGPHTHVLPKLMAAGRTHSANTPIPPGLMPAMNLHPASPVMTALGEDRAFDGTLFDAFQALLEAWGPAPYVSTKRRVWAALDRGDGPEPDANARDRVERVARRNAIRQRARGHGAGPTLAAWSAAHDRGLVDADPEMLGH